MKFIGHLDMVRYFQKVMRRADVDVCYSEGFSPHQKMSFAAPLSVGIISKGEYFDLEVNSTDSSEKMLERLNNQNVEGVEVLSYKLLKDSDKKAMSMVEKFYNQKEITILKKTKRSEKIVNIKPMIHKLSVDKNGIFMQVDQGSVSNLKPDLVVEALSQYTGIKLPDFIQYERLDMYYIENNELKSLDDVGGQIG